MPKSSTESFVTEYGLRTSSYEDSVLRKRFWAAKQQYNALLGECLKRLNRLRRDPRFSEALSIYKEEGRKLEARRLFKALEKEYGYSEYSLHTYSKQWTKTDLSIGADLSQKLAKRVFSAVDQYKRKLRGKPRFKGYRGVSSIEGKAVSTPSLKEETVHYLGLKLPLIIDRKDPIHHHGLSCKLKYIRLVQRQIGGKTRYFAQLISEGKPWIKSKNQSNAGVVGLDIGPQTIALVSPQAKQASLQVFADGIKQQQQVKKKLQQKLSRQLRINNPSCFEAEKWKKKDKHWEKKQGKNIKGKRLIVRSQGAEQTRKQLADICRKEAAYRKTAHGTLVNDILRIGNQVKLEKLSYQSFQKNYGKSVGLRAPGQFVEHLRRKAANAGGGVEEISTYKTKLSQACQCGTYKKKSLKERWHVCSSCAVEAQRDLYSAYLACFVEKDQLMADQAKKAWSGMDIALNAAMEELKHSNSRAMPASLGLRSGAENVALSVP